MIQTPEFIDSPYLIIDETGWKLKENAPKELKEKFDEYMKLVNSHIKEEKE